MSRSVVSEVFKMGIPIDILADGTLLAGINRVKAHRRGRTIKARIYETGEIVDFKISDIKYDRLPDQHPPSPWPPSGTH